jgi:hypothetical protein
LKIFSLSNQNDLTLPETSFELLMVRNLQADLPQLQGELKINFGTKNQMSLVDTGFREISSRENAP